MVAAQVEVPRTSRGLGGTPVLVLGMHRSGTSAVAQLVHRLGVPAGPESERMPAAASNPSGHWEITRLSNLDDEVLDVLGASWSAPPRRPIDLAAVPVELAERATSTWREVFGDGEVVWKDPRACLLVPFWRALLPAPPIVVLVVRDPRAVARSLQARDGLPVEYGVALWERHLRFAVHRVGVAAQRRADRLEGELTGERTAGAAHVAALHADLEARSDQASRLADEVMSARSQVAELDAALAKVRSRRSYRAWQAVRRATGRR